MMKRKFIVGLAIGICIAAVGQNSNATQINWTSGDYFQAGIGDTNNTQYDQLSITGTSGTINLTLNTPVTVDIGTYLFTTGYNSDYVHNSPNYDESVTFNVNGTNGTIRNKYYANINNFDTLYMSVGQTEAFDFGNGAVLDVTPLGGTFYDTNGTPQNLQATFNLVGNPVTFNLVGNPVPEPMTMILFGTGLIGIAGLTIKRKK